MQAKTTMIELTNSELKQKAIHAYKTLRKLRDFHADELRRLEARKQKNEIDDEKYKELRRAEIERAGREYNDGPKTDAIMVLGELKNRIPLRYRKHIPGLPEIMPADRRFGGISIAGVANSPELGTPYLNELATQIEELAKLLGR